MNKNILISTIVVVLLAGGIWYMRDTKERLAMETTSPATEQTVSDTTTVAQEPASTGKVDDIFSSFSDEQSAELATTQAGDKDAETAISDGAAINDLTQTYDETAL